MLPLLPCPANYESWVAVAVGEQQDILNARLSEALVHKEDVGGDENKEKRQQQHQPTVTLLEACSLAKRLLSSLTIEGKIEQEEGEQSVLEMGVVIGAIPEEANEESQEGLPACIFLDTESFLNK